MKNQAAMRVMLSVAVGTILICGCSGKRPIINGVSTEGLLLYYSFDSAGAETIHDDSGNENDGIVRGATYLPEGRVGGAFYMGKSIGYVEVPNMDLGLLRTNDFSLAFWFRPQREMDNRDHFFIGCDEGGGNRNKWGFEYNQKSLMFHMNRPGGRDGQRIAAYPWMPENGQWYHLAVTRSANDYSIYVDGRIVSQQQNQKELPTVKAPLTIGQAENLYVEGVMDEVLIFGRCLSPTEVAQLCGVKK